MNVEMMIRPSRSKMTVINVSWHPYLNVVYIRCECGARFTVWANNSGVICPCCGAPGLWHGVNQTGDTIGPGVVWNLYPIMEIKLDEAQAS